MKECLKLIENELFYLIKRVVNSLAFLAKKSQVANYIAES